MQLGNSLAPYTQTPQLAPPTSTASVPPTSPTTTSPTPTTPLTILDEPASQGVIVNISAEAQAAYARDKGQNPAGTAQGGIADIEKAAELEGCQTCKNRKYVDVSDDSSVSFQTPTRLSPAQAASAVMSHEMEHVSHEQANAEKNDRRVISQSVTLQTSVCPECGRMYISGGVTRTLTANAPKGNDSEELTAPPAENS